MSRRTHNGTGTVINEYVVGNPNRDIFTGHRMFGISAGEKTFFFNIRRGTVNFVQIAYFVNECVQFRFIRFIGD